MQRNLLEKVESLTQRLDHSVPDPKLSASENAAAAAELRALSGRLYDLLPDKSLSPLERLERFSRVVEREPRVELLKSAHEKVQELKQRINELVPGDASVHDKLLTLEQQLNERAGMERAHLSAISKLEILGDPRGGIEPV